MERIAVSACAGNGRRPRVALVVSHLRPGGKERFVVDLAAGLSGGPFEPVVVCFEPGGALERGLVERGVRAVVVGKRRGNDLKLPFALARVFRRERVDVVHSNNWGALAESVVAARLGRVAVTVHTQHGLEFGTGRSRLEAVRPLHRLARRLSARAVHHIAAVSREVGEMVVRDWCVPSSKVSVIHNGVAVADSALDDERRAERRRRLGLAPDDYVIGSVGVFRPVKDYPTLVRAMAEVAVRRRDARLVLVGDGPSRPEIEETIGRLGLEPVVRLLGMRADVPDLLPLFDLFVLCSLSEGISLSILEAMAAGLPIVATAVGGNPEIVEAGTGVLVPPASPSAVARAILALGQDTAIRRRMGRCAQERVRAHFSLERMVADYQALYSRLLGLSR